MSRSHSLEPAPNLSDWLPAPVAPPVFRERDGMWILSRYADVAAAFRQPDIAAVEAAQQLRHLTLRAGMQCPFLEAQLRGVLLNSNPPWHTQARQFSKIALRRLEDALPPDVVAALAWQFVDSLPRGETFDIVPICDHMAIRIIARGLDVPDGVIREITERTFAIYENFRRHTPLRLLQRFEVMAAALSALVSEHLSGTPALDHIRARGHDECGLTPGEMDSILAFFLAAATETTSTFFAGAVQLLGMHPGTVDAIRDDGAWLRPAFEELVRYSTPAGAAVGFRLTTAPLELGDRTLPPDATLLLDTRRAHFDPAAFTEPWRFDHRRRGPPHFGFGGGAHVCLGAAFARRQAMALLSHLLECRDITPQVSPMDWCKDTYTRRLRHLKVTLHSRC